MKAKITRLDKSVELPKYHTEESAGFDLAANADVTIQPGEIAKVPTGLVIESPKGHFLMIVSRGSTATKKGLKMANAIGIVDRDYAGPNDEIFMPLHNFINSVVEIKKGERLGQGMFIRVDQVEWDEVQIIRDSDRGGYGSTGGYQNT